jgi:hypothetical protein
MNPIWYQVSNWVIMLPVEDRGSLINYCVPLKPSVAKTTAKPTARTSMG